MADPTAEQLSPVEAQFNSHPAIQAFIANMGKGKNSVLDLMRAYSQAARDLGIQVPHDYQPTIQGGQVKLEKKSFIERNGWFLPAVAVGAPLVAGAALGAFGGAAAAPAAGSVLPSTTVSGLGATVAGPVSGSAAAAEAAGGAAGGWGGLARAAGSKFLNGRGISNILGAASGSMANNRGAGIAAGLDADQVATQRQAENRTERDDAWKRLQNADYAQHTQGYTNPRGLPSFGIARTGPMGADVLKGSQGLEDEAMRRLVDGPQIRPLTDVEKKSKMGGWEKFMNIAGPVAGFFGR
jgi:hypothetical protein